MGNPDSTENKKKAETVDKKEKKEYREKDKNSEKKKRTRVQRMNKYLWRPRSRKQKKIKKSDQPCSRNCNLETFCNWESSLEQSSSYNAGAREKNNRPRKCGEFSVTTLSGF